MIKPRVWSLLVCCSIVLALRADAVDTNYVVGTGIYDVTGPAAEINMVMCSTYITKAKLHLLGFVLCPCVQLIIVSSNFVNGFCTSVIA